MSMTKKDYEVLAQALRDAVNIAQLSDAQALDLSAVLADRLGRVNPAFSREKWDAALSGKPARPRPAFYQHWRAPNDPNGNPQRLYVVFDAEGRILRIIDEGYRGLPPELRNVRQAIGPEISRSEYHAMKRQPADIVEGD